MNRNYTKGTDLTSVFAVKQARPNRLMDLEASLTDAYLTVEQESGIKSLTEDPVGKDKW